MRRSKSGKNKAKPLEPEEAFFIVPFLPSLSHARLSIVAYGASIRSGIVWPGRKNPVCPGPPLALSVKWGQLNLYCKVILQVTWAISREQSAQNGHWAEVSS